MQQLESLTQEASELGGGRDRRMSGDVHLHRQVIRLTESETEVQRQMQICNACRYCEGFCAVFPAMTRRLSFAKADVNYLANLCHNCGACYHACQYAPPHEFAVNVPQAMAKVRVDTYAEYAWPPSLGKLYRHSGATVALALAFGLALFMWLATVLSPRVLQGSRVSTFYSIFPHHVLVVIFGTVFVYAMLALAIGVRRFWKDIAAGTAGLSAVAETTTDVLTLKYLGGGHGEGCNERDDAFTLLRRRFHHLTFYGFMLCFASTAVATIYHYVFRMEAPYMLTSAPVLLGTVGGLSLVVGSAGLLWLNVRRDPMRGDAAQKPMDRGFMLLLLWTGISGLVLLTWRASAAMPSLLAVHLGGVMALFLTFPYGKFAHGIFRSAALLKSAIERRERNSLQLGSD
ncbi:tricarballylate utilization 4Fe-4S protein TcuB [Paraburkholderia tropica]|uniref:tricarballylate utilization 4Fe-4S protein TcuB n=1 Tax=Paraburkholderia tropica TaxID=92647 RepID=UPI002AB7EF5C|nr:tricarballylate utilization 4Fe-4S protein TcuB [Paraburkholderia tropica]